MYNLLMIFLAWLLLIPSSSASDEFLNDDTRLKIVCFLDSDSAKQLAMTTRCFNQNVSQRKSLVLSESFFTELLAAVQKNSDLSRYIAFLEKMSDAKKLGVKVLPAENEHNYTIYSILAGKFNSLVKLHIHFSNSHTNEFRSLYRICSLGLFADNNNKLQKVSIRGLCFKIDTPITQELVTVATETPHLMSLIQKLPPLELCHKTLVVLRNSKGLKHLDLQNKELLTPEALSEIAKSCPKLKKFNLRGAYQIDIKSIIELIRLCPALTCVDQETLRIIDTSNLEASDEVCPGMDTLNALQGTKINQLVYDICELCPGNILLTPCDCSLLASNNSLPSFE